MHTGPLQFTFSNSESKFDIKVNISSDPLYSVVKGVPLYRLLRLQCPCRDHFVLPVMGEKTCPSANLISFPMR